jgi:hypothetical protein
VKASKGKSRGKSRGKGKGQKGTRKSTSNDPERERKRERIKQAKKTYNDAKVQVGIYRESGSSGSGSSSDSDSDSIHSGYNSGSGSSGIYINSEDSEEIDRELLCHICNDLERSAEMLALVPVQVDAKTGDTRAAVSDSGSGSESHSESESVVDAGLSKTRRRGSSRQSSDSAANGVGDISTAGHHGLRSRSTHSNTIRASKTRPRSSSGNGGDRSDSGYTTTTITTTGATNKSRRLAPPDLTVRSDVFDFD